MSSPMQFRDPGTTRASRRLGGFSLVELSIVLAIVAVLSAIAIPRYANAQTRYQADSVALRLKNDIDLIRRNAMQTSTSRELVLGVNDDFYVLIGVDGLDDAGENYTVLLNRQPYDAEVVSAFGAVRDFDGCKCLAVTFDGYGKPDAGGSIVIQVGDQQREVTIDVDTGKAVIQ